MKTQKCNKKMGNFGVILAKKFFLPTTKDTKTCIGANISNEAEFFDIIFLV